jgi:S1-C subfamily serine protease
MRELRLLGRAASGLAILALLLAALALHGLRAHPAGAPPMLGATLAGPVPVVTSLREGGRADRAGLHVGDVVEAVDGRDPASLAEVERQMASGTPVGLRVRRGADRIAITVR